MTDSELDIVADRLFKKLTSNFVLVEKTFNLPTKNDVKSLHKEKNFAFATNIIDKVAKYYKVPDPNLIRVKSRLQNKMKMRLIAMQLFRDLPEEQPAYGIVGEFFCCDHSTVIYNANRFEKKYRIDTDFRLEYHDIRSAVEQSLKLT